MGCQSSSEGDFSKPIESFSNRAIDEKRMGSQ